MSDKYAWGKQTNKIIKTVEIIIQPIYSHWIEFVHKKKKYIMCNNCCWIFKPFTVNKETVCNHCGAIMNGDVENSNYDDVKKRWKELNNENII